MLIEGRKAVLSDSKVVKIRDFLKVFAVSVDLARWSNEDRIAAGIKCVTRLYDWPA